MNAEVLERLNDLEAKIQVLADDIIGLENNIISGHDKANNSFNALNEVTTELSGEISSVVRTNTLHIRALEILLTSAFGFMLNAPNGEDALEVIFDDAEISAALTIADAEIQLAVLNKMHALREAAQASADLQT